ncbi:MAG: hypothetical protein GW936_01590 [Gallionella sp.]|nr:hypothetical protein [Gallionella sp.]HCJ50244.1 hypothetical protein [Gallionella sp.]
MLSNKNYIKNLIIAGAFIALGIFLPGSTIADQAAFTANITGISTGIGIGWLIKTVFEQKPAKQEA